MYKINNISLLDYGIEAGRVSGEGIAVKGIFDLPKRIGDTHFNWAENDSVEPYVDYGQMRFGGRTILFAGIMLGSKIEIENKLKVFEAAIAQFNDVVRFETPYGNACVWIKKITPTIKTYNASVIIEMREPNVGATCNILTPPTIYYSEAYAESATKNDCASGYEGSTVQLTAVAGKFQSTYSQLAANQLAIDWVKANKQQYANEHGVCTLLPPVYYNVKLTGELQKDNCSAGSYGTTVKYTVPAFKYSSTVSQADADAQAQAELDATLTQAYANANGTCVLLPSFDSIYNYSAGPGEVRVQRFLVGANVEAGTEFNLMVYGVLITYVAELGDTPTTVVDELVNLINNTSATEWNAKNSAPSGGVGFPPTAIREGSDVIKLTLNFQNQFSGWVSYTP